MAACGLLLKPLGSVLLPPPRWRLCRLRSVYLSLCLSFCVQDYCKTNRPISLKLSVMIGLTDRMNLTFGGDPLPDTDSG